MKKYRKFGVAALTAGLVFFGAAVSGHQITPDEWTLIVTTALGALGVYTIPNHHDGAANATANDTQEAK